MAHIKCLPAPKCHTDRMKPVKTIEKGPSLQMNKQVLHPIMQYNHFFQIRQVKITGTHQWHFIILYIFGPFCTSMFFKAHETSLSSSFWMPTCPVPWLSASLSNVLLWKRTCDVAGHNQTILSHKHNKILCNHFIWLFFMASYDQWCYITAYRKIIQ